MSEATVQPRYLSLADAARYTGFSIRTLNQLIRERQIPASKLGSAPQGRVRIRIDDLDAFMASARV